MANNEKQKKGFISSFYKSSIVNNKQKSELSMANKIVSRSSWFTKKAKSKISVGDLKGQRLPEKEAGGDFVHARRSASEVEPNMASFTLFLRGSGNAVPRTEGSSCGGELDLMVQGRKSVSQIEQARKSVSPVEPARKSVSYIEPARKSVSHVEQSRKSVCHIEPARKSVSHIENSLASVRNIQVKVLVSDMPKFMQVHAFQCARRTYDSLDNFSSKQIACNIKKEFDKVYGPAWHCIVGSGFGSFVTHATGCFLYFSMRNLYILVFRTMVKRLSD